MKLGILHSAYISAQAPSDYRLFRIMAHLLEGQLRRRKTRHLGIFLPSYASNQEGMKGVKLLALWWVQVTDYDGIYLKK